MGMLVVTALVTFFVQRQELWSIGKKAAVKMAGTAVVDVLAPGLHYEEKENGNHFLAKVEKILFPIADYTVQIKSYETDAESTLSYEMILAMEALDENYVDENGQVVMQNNGGTDSPQPADGTQNADNHRQQTVHRTPIIRRQLQLHRTRIPHRKHPIPQSRHLSQLHRP